MKSHPKVRKVARWLSLTACRPETRQVVKWIGTAIGTVILTIWLLSGWWMLKYENPSAYILVEHGTLWVNVGKQVANPWAPPNGLTRNFYKSFELDWGRLGYNECFGPGTLVVPLWWGFLVIAVPTAYQWRLVHIARRRSLRGKCTHCKFDLAGLPLDATCPECGKNSLREKSHTSAPT